MTDQSKRNFILALKRLRFFFNHLKDYEEGLEMRADYQACNPDDINEKINPMAKWMDEATKAIVESKRFIELIQLQENEKVESLIIQKQDQIDGEDQELQALEAQIASLKSDISQKHQQEVSIRQEILEENFQTNQQLEKLDNEISYIQSEQHTEENLINGKICQLEDIRDKVVFEYQKVKQTHSKYQDMNKFLYFFPQKVFNQKERIQRKKEELKLYQSIIEESLSFFTDKIEENKSKQVLVQQMNAEVAQIVKGVLIAEEEFYNKEQYDKLKTPPYVMIKRIERDPNQN
eukprot:403372217